MGVVYEVRHPEQPGRRLALKLLLTEDPPRELLARFKREAEVLGVLEHPNVIGVVDFDQAPDGKPYLVCDFVAGKTLRELCRDDPMEPEQAARIIRDLSDALGELHKRQILHRDIKPENIMLSEDAEPMLLDFGLAKDLDGERLTVTGSILGTPSYMAPEQAEGAGLLDARTDVYGLGATLFFLLCGRPPFRGKQPMAVLRQVLMDEPVWPTGDDREDQRIRREAAQAALTPAPKAAPEVFNQDVTVWNAGEGPSGFHHNPTVIGALAETDVAASRPPGALAPPGSTDFQEDATMLSVPGVTPPGVADPTFYSSPNAGQAQPSTARIDLEGTMVSGHGLQPTGLGLPGTQFGSRPGEDLAGTQIGSQHGPPPEAFGTLPGGSFGTLPGGSFGNLPGGAPTGFGSMPGAPPAAQGAPTQAFEFRDFATEDALAAERASSSVVHAPIDSRIPKALVAITKLAMAKDPRDRYQTSAELRDDLDRFLNSGQAGADAALRSQGWRRRLPLLLGVLGLLILGGGVAAYVLEDAPAPPPSASPSASETPTRTHPPATPSPSVSATPTPSPSHGPKPESLQAAVAALPFLGSAEFPAALAGARHHYPQAELLRRLRQARVDLEELRKATSPASRATLSVRWLREHRRIPSDLKGPVALELTPRRFRHNTESAESPLEFEKLLRRQWYLATHVSWLDTEGTRLLVTDAQQLSVWDLSQGLPDQPASRESLQDRAWFTTFVSRSLPEERVAYFSGSALIPDGRGGVLMKGPREPRRLAGFGRVGPDGVITVGRFSEGVDGGTDRAICMDVSPDGAWLAAGSERGEVLLLKLGAEGSGGSLYVVRHDEERTDLQGMAFLSNGDLLSLAGMRGEPSSLIRWRLEDLELQEVNRLSFGDGEDPPASLVSLPNDRVLMGRSDGRLVLIDCSDPEQPPRVTQEVTSEELPPFAGSHGRTAWGPLTFVGRGQSRTYRRPQDQERGGVIEAWRNAEKLESLASFRLSDPLDSFTSVALSPDGKKLAAGTISGEVLIWELGE
jgi:serine/threonine protein kinase/WD40 repeat protein